MKALVVPIILAVGIIFITAGVVADTHLSRIAYCLIGGAFIGAYSNVTNT